MRASGVGGGRRAPDEQARRLGLDGDVGEQFLYELELRDRPRELPPLARVRHRRVEAALRDADAAGAERDPAVVERRHRDLEAGSDVPEARVVRHAHAVEEELARVLSA